MPFKARQGAYVAYKGGYYPRPSLQGGKPQRSAVKIILVRALSRVSEAGTRGPREAPHSPVHRAPAAAHILPNTPRCES